ncbi:hypothetical protein Desti_0993 [Desulfomonile tiedjei DSM 6799]|uniref:Helix-turn-helix domain-containing protein n=1 Tax=Desulfomonile tiedjei (strain ATCC 49306 / DSM 6799 / DCB-1) TaxID=706587 RepID=I4C2C0_DESTA|nr:hypothetical protein Desti_0993 [Desulfomonile tiedjei DSM 6799]
MELERYSRVKLAERWGVSPRTIDRMRIDGRLPWLDLSGGKGARPIVRFKLSDILAYEEKFRQAPCDLTPDRGPR